MGYLEGMYNHVARKNAYALVYILSGCISRARDSTVGVTGDRREYHVEDFLRAVPATKINWPRTHTYYQLASASFVEMAQKHLEKVYEIFKEFPKQLYHKLTDLNMGLQIPDDEADEPTTMPTIATTRAKRQVRNPAKEFDEYICQHPYWKKKLAEDVATKTARKRKDIPLSKAKQASSRRYYGR